MPVVTGLLGTLLESLVFLCLLGNRFGGLGEMVLELGWGGLGGSVTKVGLAWSPLNTLMMDIPAWK